MNKLGVTALICVVNLAGVAAIVRDNAFPPMKLDFVNIKTPQLIGIIAGCLVFIVTISVVIYLLYASGSLSKLMEELRTAPTALPSTKVESACSPQFQNIPELYDNLIHAMNTLPKKPVVGKLVGKTVSVKPFDAVTDTEVLFNACNGSAQYNESAYDPARLWGWLDASSGSSNGNGPKSAESTASITVADGYPSASKSNFSSLYDATAADSLHLVIVDKELDRQIGMLSLVDNNPKSLSVRIDNLWLTPAFQSKRRSHEAILLVLQALTSAGYRRITAELDERHVIGRKFLERCGFQLEAILRKHKIVQRRNRNTALYVVLNTDFQEVELKIKTLLGWSLLPEVHKVAEMELGVKREAMPSGAAASAGAAAAAGAGGKKKKNKNKK